MRTRLDQHLVELGLAKSRSEAQGLILAGKVTVDGKLVTKAGFGVLPQAQVEIAVAKRFAGRAGDKLAGALQTLAVPIAGKRVLDCGISTGGFADCLLQAGAKQVIGIDVGYGQLDWRIRQDPRVILLERTNFRYLFAWQHWQPRPEVQAMVESWRQQIDLITLDLSFISLTKVVDSVVQLLKPEGELLAMVKPQFELDRGSIGKGGVVRDSTLHQRSVESVIAAYTSAGLHLKGVAESVLPGADGNREFFVYFDRRPE